MKYKATILTFNPYTETRLIEQAERDVNNGKKTEYQINKDGQVLSATYHYVFYERSNWMTIPVTEEAQKHFTLGILHAKGLTQIPIGELDLSKYDYLTSMVFISTAKVDLTPQLEERLWKILYVYEQRGYEQAKAIAKHVLNYDGSEAMMLVIAEYFQGGLARLIDENMPKYDWDKRELLCLSERLKKQGEELFREEVEEFVIPKATKAVSNFIIPSKVKKVVLHDGVTAIRRWAFQTCVIGQLFLPDSVTHIEECAFFRCSVQNFRLSTGLKHIGRQAFYNASVGEELVFADSLERIEREAFNGCNVKKVVLPKSVQYIGWDAFAKCANLTEVTMPSSFYCSSNKYLEDKYPVDTTQFDELQKIFGDNYKNIKFKFWN